MQRPGELLGTGATADVYAYGADDVVKLAKASEPVSFIDWEVRAMRAVAESGARVPAVRGVVEIDGRRGLVMERLEGRSLLEEMLAGAITPEVCGRILAESAHRLHRVHSRDGGLRSFRESAVITLRGIEGRFSTRLVTEARRLLAILPDGDAICHGDLHPINVLVTPVGVGS